MPHYALYLTIDDEDDEQINYYPKLENHVISIAEIEEYLTKNGVKKWSIYDHIPNEEDIECFTGVCFDSSDGEYE